MISSFLNPAFIPVAGDAGDIIASPTYASFQTVATVNATSNRSPDRIGGSVTTWIDMSGTVTDAAPTGNDGERLLRRDARPQYSQCLLELDERPSEWDVTLRSWVYPMGLPMTEPYRITATVRGQKKSVLVQLFERRVLTYTPDNAPEWRVEMGNVGRSYMNWAHPPTDTNVIWSADSQQLVFASQRIGN